MAQKGHISEKWHSASSLVNTMLRAPPVLTLLVLSPSLEFLLLFLLCVVSDKKKSFQLPSRHVGTLGMAFERSGAQG